MSARPSIDEQVPVLTGQVAPLLIISSRSIGIVGIPRSRQVAEQKARDAKFASDVEEVRRETS